MWKTLSESVIRMIGWRERANEGNQNMAGREMQQMAKRGRWCSKTGYVLKAWHDEDGGVGKSSLVKFAMMS